MADRIPSILDRPSTPPDQRIHANIQHTNTISPKRAGALIRPLPISPSRIVYPPKRPDWWDDAHRLLRDLAFRNQENPLGQRDLVEIYKLTDLLIANQNPVELLMFMKLLSEFIVYDSKKLFFKVLVALRSLSPEIDQYFFDIDTDDPSEGPSLSPMAINEMFRFYEEEFHYPVGMFSYQNLSALRRFVDQIIESDSDQIHGCILHNDLQPDDPHVVPLFALKQNGTTHLFIFDSLGHSISSDQDKTQISAALKFLIESYQNRSDLRGKLELYSYKNKRQNSEVGCVTFSLLDLKNLCERHIHHGLNIIDFYSLQDPEHLPRRVNEELQIGSDVAVYEIDTLPPEMMKVTQSVKKFDYYQRHPPVLSPPIPRFIRYTSGAETVDALQDLEALHKSVDQVIRTTSDGNAVNFYVEQKRFMDIIYLMTRYFNSGIVPKYIPRALQKISGNN